MQITKIQPAVTSTAFGCNGGNCCCKGTCVPKFDSTPDKISRLKKSANFVKENKSAIKVTLASALTGLLTGCTILGANQIMSKITKADTSDLAVKLATFGGLIAGATNMVNHKDAFKKHPIKN